MLKLKCVCVVVERIYYMYCGFEVKKKMFKGGIYPIGESFNGKNPHWRWSNNVDRKVIFSSLSTKKTKTTLERVCMLVCAGVRCNTSEKQARESEK